MKRTALFATIMMSVFASALWAADASEEAQEEALPYHPGPSVTEMTSMLHLDAALLASKSSPLLLFKHSTTCSISAGAAERLNDYVEALGEKAPRIVFVKVIEAKPISEAVEKRLGVEHESPQMILVKDGKAVWSITHEAITGEAIAEALEAALSGTKKDS